MILDGEQKANVKEWTWGDESEVLPQLCGTAVWLPAEKSCPIVQVIQSHKLAFRAKIGLDGTEQRISWADVKAPPSLRNQTLLGARPGPSLASICENWLHFWSCFWWAIKSHAVAQTCWKSTEDLTFCAKIKDKIRLKGQFLNVSLLMQLPHAWHFW